MTRLKASGFLLDFGEDNTGIAGKYIRRASGYYIDVGGSDLIADGEIKVRSGVGVAEIRPRSVVLSDGSRIAGGRHHLCDRLWTDGELGRSADLEGGRAARRPLLGPRIGHGAGSRAVGRRTAQHVEADAQDGLWFHGGNLAQSRLYSLHLALQLKARMEGLRRRSIGRRRIVRARD